jgi:hypothetical protein
MLSGPKAADPILTTTLFVTQHAGPTTRFVTGWPCNGNGMDRLGCESTATGNPRSGAPSLSKQQPGRGIGGRGRCQQLRAMRGWLRRKAESMLNVSDKRVVMRSADFDQIGSPTVNSLFLNLRVTELLGSIGHRPVVARERVAR